MTTPPHPNTSTSDPREHHPPHARFGLLVAMLIILLLAVLLTARGGILQRAEWVALYVGVALVTGIVFWLVAPGGKSELSMPQYGMRLGGGAAVGAIFMLIAHKITPGPEIRAFELPTEIRRSHTVQILDSSPRIDVEIVNKRLLLVEFRESQNDGEVTLEYFQELRQERICFLVSRVGELRPCIVRERGEPI